MSRATLSITGLVLGASLLSAGGIPAHAGSTDLDGFAEKLSDLQTEVDDLKQQLATSRPQTPGGLLDILAAPDADIHWQLAGYATANYGYSDNAAVSSMFSGSFSPIFLVGYKDLALFEAELEIETSSDGMTEIMLEYGALNIFVNDWLILTAGKFLSPLGDFRQHLHPSWINKLPDAPAGFVEEGGAIALSETGVMVRGAFPAGSTTFDYAVYVGNGPRLAEMLDDGIENEGFGGDDNSNKAVGAKLGFHPFPSLSLGVSVMRAQIQGNEGTGGATTEGDYDMVGVDAAFVNGNWSIRGEYVQSHLDELVTAADPDSAPALIEPTTWRAWYAQASYRLAGLTNDPVIGNLEPVVRYSQLEVRGEGDFEGNNERRFSAGLDYWFAPSLVGKIAYERRDFESQPNQNVFRAQLAFGF